MPRTGKGETRVVTLASGGTVTLTLDAKLLLLDEADRRFLGSLINMLNDYGRATLTQPAPAPIDHVAVTMHRDPDLLG